MKIKALYILAAVAVTATLASCEDSLTDDMVQSAPVVETFLPAEGYAGCEITVKGTSLNNVVAAKIGDTDAIVAQRVSDRQIIIKVPAQASTGKITLSNSVGSGSSATDFIISYPAPEADLATLPGDVELSSNMLIFGKKMSVITRVLFSAPGNEPHEAEIISQSDSEIVVKVPYVEADNANISFEYFDGTSLITTDPSEITVVMARFQPNVTDVSTSSASIGETVTLGGQYLDKVDRVLLAGEECLITQQTPETLKFIVPELAGFADGENVATLEIEYFDGVERNVLVPEFRVTVPMVLFWENRKVWAQGRDVEEFTSFFSPQTGLAYANSMWRDLDPISFKYQEGTCSAAQEPAVSQSEYDSVVPYFFFTGVSAGHLQINSPAGSASMLKNIFTENNSSNDFRVTGANANCYGTPVLSFLTLDNGNAAHAKLIEKVRTKTLDRLDEETYPLDVDAKKIGDISISGMSNSLNNTKFAPDVFTVGQALNTDVDVYILVLYYNHKGLNSSNRAENVRRMGVLHIKHIDFRPYNNTDAPSSSSVTFDMYWMKHDYKQ
ncbi:MAG: IPT/TIG domain-containing protein [Muribaculaceae bacterium]|nr:IPT/TIG domain-containing protein [Muribaculaceae bacterium]